MRIFISLISLMLFVACSSENDDIEEDFKPLQEEEVNILFSPSSFGDQSYNDMILYGIQKSCNEHRFRLTLHQPQNVAEGWNMYKEWQAKPVADHKQLFIFASSEYEDSLRNNVPSPTPNRSVLLFEAKEEIKNAATFNMETYGSAYYMGQLASHLVSEAAVLLANEEDHNLKHCAKGFEDGFMETNSDFIFANLYIGSKIDEGYNQADIAYRMSSLLFRNFKFIFPVAGGSNMGVYRYCRENPEGIYTAGMDGDMSGMTTNMVGSLVKRMDLALENYIQRWLAGEPIEGHTSFGLESTYVSTVVSSNFKSFFAPFLMGLKDKAIQKEHEYLENL